MASRLTSILEEFASRDDRIRVKTLPKNSGIAAATNAGLAICSGDYVGFLDHDDELADVALLENVRALNEDPSLDVLYSDEDKLDAQGNRYDVFFKPDWSPDLLRSCNYITHFLVCRRSLIEQVGGLRLGFDGSQDYDLILRLSERTDHIRRIPKVLYHWRAIPGSAALSVDAKPHASQLSRLALTEPPLSRPTPAAVANPNGNASRGCRRKSKSRTKFSPS